MPAIEVLRLGRELSGLLPNTKIVIEPESCLFDPEQLECLQKGGYDFASLPAPFKKEAVLKKVDSWVRAGTKFDSIMGFRDEDDLEFLVEIEIIFRQGSPTPYDCFSLVFFEIVEKWPEGDPPTEGQRKKLFGELAYGLRENCALHLQHLLFDCFRYDGNRFGVELSYDSHDCAEGLAAKLRRFVQETEWSTLVGCTVEISAKFAVVSFPEDGRTAAELINKGASRLQ